MLFMASHSSIDNQEQAKQNESQLQQNKGKEADMSEFAITSQKDSILLRQALNLRTQKQKAKITEGTSTSSHQNIEQNPGSSQSHHLKQIHSECIQEKASVFHESSD